LREGRKRSRLSTLSNQPTYHAASFQFAGQPLFLSTRSLQALLSLQTFFSTHARAPPLAAAAHSSAAASSIAYRMMDGGLVS